MNNLFLDHKLSNNSWFGLGGKAKKFFTPDTEEELIDYIKNIQLDNFVTIGSGSNILFRDKGCSGTVIKLGKNFRKIDIIDESLICGSGVLKSHVSKFAFLRKLFFQFSDLMLKLFVELKTLIIKH